MEVIPTNTGKINGLIAFLIKCESNERETLKFQLFFGFLRQVLFLAKTSSAFSFKTTDTITNKVYFQCQWAI